MINFPALMSGKVKYDRNILNTVPTINQLIELLFDLCMICIEHTVAISVDLVSFPSNFFRLVDMDRLFPPLAPRTTLLLRCY